ncbi:dolichol phosphate-mannose biosynthesis regulatory protein-domain-containing protein [Trametes punicea]|nr:dolichol phosphate-mannose biosynthesis regulatory protein-domain-containing protein [Trametes punicea]
MRCSDKACGNIMLLVAAVTILYYTFWALLLPFLDDSSPLHMWFPSREWALRVPALIVVLGISAIGSFLGARIVQGAGANRRRRTRRRTESGMSTPLAPLVDHT